MTAIGRLAKLVFAQASAKVLHDSLVELGFYDLAGVLHEIGVRLEREVADHVRVSSGRAAQESERLS